MSGLAAASIGPFKDRDAWTITEDGTIVGNARDNSWVEVARHGVPIEILVDDSHGPELDRCIIEPIVMQNTAKSTFVSITSHKDCGRSFRKGSKKSQAKQSKSFKKPSYMRKVPKKTPKKTPKHRTVASNADGKMSGKTLLFEELDAEEYQDFEYNFSYNSSFDDDWYSDYYESVDSDYDEHFNLMFWHSPLTRYGPVFMRSNPEGGYFMQRFCFTCNCDHEIAIN